MMPVNFPSDFIFITLLLARVEQKMPIISDVTDAFESPNVNHSITKKLYKFLVVVVICLLFIYQIVYYNKNEDLFHRFSKTQFSLKILKF